MPDSRYIAGLVGPALAAVTLSEIVNAEIWRGVSAPAVYQACLMAFVAGLAIVRAHNVWTWAWPVLLTLVGWFFFAGGLARMFFTRPHARAQATRRSRSRRKQRSWASPCS